MTAQQKEELRIVVLGYLAERHPLAFHPDAIRATLSRRQAVDFPISAIDLDSALAMLSDLCLASCTTDRLGTTKHWAASAEGLLEAERRGII